MDKIEAQELLNEYLQKLKGRSLSDLKAYIGSPECITILGRTGVEYQIEYESFWDSSPEGDLRVMASIDDGGFFSALRPITDSFIVTSQGEVID